MFNKIKKYTFNKESARLAVAEFCRRLERAEGVDVLRCTVPFEVIRRTRQEMEEELR